MRDCKTIQLGPKEERGAQDFYSTDPKATAYLFVVLKRVGLQLPYLCIEPSVGAGHIAKILQRLGHAVYCYDIVDRGFPGTYVCDWKQAVRPTEEPLGVVMNPPYNEALEHLIHTLEMLKDGELCCALLRLQFLETIKRKAFFEKYPMRYLAVFSFRIKCNKNDDKNFMGGSHSAVAYAWFIWQKGYKGRPELLWI